MDNLITPSGVRSEGVSIIVELVTFSKFFPQRKCRKAFGDQAFLKRLPRGFGGGVGRIAAVQQRGRFSRQHLLGLVDLGTLQCSEPHDLTHRQDREQF
jgi:hypothetical protein